jgi:hypothetical protein
MCGPIPIVMGIVTAGLGIGQSIAGAQAAQDQVAFANAQAQQQFASQQNSAMVARGYEQLKANQQEEVKRITRLFADNAFANDVAGFNSRFMQEQAASSQEQQKGAIAGLKARGEVLASGRLGNTPDNLIADFYRQQAQYDFATSQNLAFMGTQLQQQKVGAAAERGSRIASAQTYIKQPVLDPLEPLYQKAPSSTPFILQGISAGVSGVTTTFSTAAAMEKAGLDPTKWNPFKK